MDGHRSRCWNGLHKSRYAGWELTRILLFMHSHANPMQLQQKTIRCWQCEARGRKLRNFKCRVHQLFYLMFTSDLSYLHQISQQSWACSHEASVINDVQMIKLILKPSLELKKWQLGGDICQNPTLNNCVWYPLCAATTCETLRISWFSVRMSCSTQACCNWSTSCRPLFHVHSWKRCSGLCITCI